VSLSSLSKISAGDVVHLFLYLRESLVQLFLMVVAWVRTEIPANLFLSTAQDEALQLNVMACRFLVYCSANK
jgi:hypothetical protein